MYAEDYWMERLVGTKFSNTKSQMVWNFYLKHSGTEDIDLMLVIFMSHVETLKDVFQPVYSIDVMVTPSSSDVDSMFAVTLTKN
jgi:hypothetical protein